MQAEGELFHIFTSFSSGGSKGIYRRPFRVWPLERQSKEGFFWVVFVEFGLFCCEIEHEQEWEEANPPALTMPCSLKGRIQLWGHPIAVDWAEPEVEVDEDTMSSVKILYVRNLMLSTTEETIEKEFNSIKPGRCCAS